MSYKGFFQILLILAIIATVCICTIKPKMHSAVFVYNSDYKIVQEEVEEYEDEEIPVVEQQTIIEPEAADIKQESVVKEVQKKNEIKTVQTPKIQTKSVTTVKTKTSVPKTEKQQSVKVQNNTPKIDVQKIVNNNQKIQNQVNKTEKAPVVKDETKPKAQTVVQTNQPVETTKPVQQQTVKTKQPEVKILTAQEEEIAWNVWRSNLTNKVMSDVNLPPVPHGTIFRFKFNLDKYGKITNLQTWSETPKYTPYAIQYIAPVIRSYQGRTILNFPAGSQRITTVAYGAWKISTGTRYSTPDDYDDVEKIKR